MTACTIIPRALCLGLALMAASASADPRDESLPITLDSLVAGVLNLNRDSSTDYDRGQEYILALGPVGAMLSPSVEPFDTDSDGYPTPLDTIESETSERGPWRHEFGLPAATSTVGESAATFAGGVPAAQAAPAVPAYIKEYLQQELPLRKTYEAEQPAAVGDLDSEDVLRRYLQQSVVPAFRNNYDAEQYSSAPFNQNNEAVVRKYLQQDLPFLTKTADDVTKPFGGHSFSTLPRPVKPLTMPFMRPISRRPVTVLPPPIVKNYAKVLPAPIIRKYLVQKIKASPPVFNKFVKNVFVEQPQQRSQPIVVVPLSPTKNVYNLIKLVAAAPRPLEAAATAAPMEIGAPSAATPLPTTTPLSVTTSAPEVPAEPLGMADKPGAEEEALDGAEPKNVDAPQFNVQHLGEAESDGPVRKVEKYGEYDQQPLAKQQAVPLLASKKQAPKNVAQLHPAVLDAAMAAASPSAGRFSQTRPQQAQLLYPRFDASRRQFGRALVSEPDNLEEMPESFVFTPAENLAEMLGESAMRMQQAGAAAPVAPLTAAAEQQVLPTATVA